MAAAVLEWMDEQGTSQVSLMGHSLGGKVAMRIACDTPERIKELFVLDVAPRVYPPDTSVLDAMIGLDLTTVRTRGDADQQLARQGMSVGLRGFLLTNLGRTDEGGFAWKVPLEVIRSLIPEWTATRLDSRDHYPGPTLFVAGGRSNYLSPSDFEAARSNFPNSTLTVLPESGHNVHVEGGDAFISAVRTAMER